MKVMHIRKFEEIDFIYDIKHSSHKYGKKGQFVWS